MLQVKNISFSYLNNVTLHNINFEIQKGNFLAIIGESGCGKSTLLKLIYGLYDLEEGEILWNKIPVLGPKFNLIPGMDFMKYLAQDFDLMPYTTVAENVGAFFSNSNSENKKARIFELLEVVEMNEFAQTKVKLLSGGQMQRVAIARVLALEPEVLLLDEPFSHIDNFRKNSLRRHLFSYLKSKKITTLIASHDSTDILSFSDEILVLKEGKIIQKGETKKIYKIPNSKYTASLFDDVSEVIVDGTIRFIYPHQFQMVKNSNLKVIVEKFYFKGSFYLIESKSDNSTIFFISDCEMEQNKIIFLQIIDDLPNENT